MQHQRQQQQPDEASPSHHLQDDEFELISSSPSSPSSTPSSYCILSRAESVAASSSTPSDGDDDAGCHTPLSDIDSVYALAIPALTRSCTDFTNQIDEQQQQQQQHEEEKIEQEFEEKKQLHEEEKKQSVPIQSQLSQPCTDPDSSTLTTDDDEEVWRLKKEEREWDEYQDKRPEEFDYIYFDQYENHQAEAYAGDSFLRPWQCQLNQVKYVRTTKKATRRVRKQVSNLQNQRREKHAASHQQCPVLTQPAGSIDMPISTTLLDVYTHFRAQLEATFHKPHLGQIVHSIHPSSIMSSYNWIETKSRPSLAALIASTPAGIDNISLRYVSVHGCHAIKQPKCLDLTQHTPENCNEKCQYDHFDHGTYNWEIRGYKSAEKLIRNENTRPLVQTLVGWTQATPSAESQPIYELRPLAHHRIIAVAVCNAPVKSRKENSLRPYDILKYGQWDTHSYEGGFYEKEWWNTIQPLFEVEFDIDTFITPTQLTHKSIQKELHRSESKASRNRKECREGVAMRKQQRALSVQQKRRQHDRREVRAEKQTPELRTEGAEYFSLSAQAELDRWEQQELETHQFLAMIIARDAYWENLFQREQQYHWKKMKRVDEDYLEDIGFAYEEDHFGVSIAYNSLLEFSNEPIQPHLLRARQHPGSLRMYQLDQDGRVVKHRACTVKFVPNQDRSSCGGMRRKRHEGTGKRTKKEKKLIRVVERRRGIDTEVMKKQEALEKKRKALKKHAPPDASAAAPSALVIPSSAPMAPPSLPLQSTTPHRLRYNSPTRKALVLHPRHLASHTIVKKRSYSTRSPSSIHQHCRGHRRLFSRPKSSHLNLKGRKVTLSVVPSTVRLDSLQLHTNRSVQRALRRALTLDTKQYELESRKARSRQISRQRNSDRRTKHEIMTQSIQQCECWSCLVGCSCYECIPWVPHTWYFAYTCN